jgi:hypothetical protein
VDEVECLIVRRIAVEVEQRQCFCHGASISRSRQRRSGRRTTIGALHKKAAARRNGPPLISTQPLAVLAALAALAWLLPALLLAGLTTLLLLAGLLLAGLTALLLAGLLAALLRVLRRIVLLLLRVALGILLFISHLDVLR